MTRFEIMASQAPGVLVPAAVAFLAVSLWTRWLPLDAFGVLVLVQSGSLVVHAIVQRLAVSGLGRLYPAAAQRGEADDLAVAVLACLVLPLAAAAAATAALALWLMPDGRGVTAALAAVAVVARGLSCVVSNLHVGALRPWRFSRLEAGQAVAELAAAFVIVRLAGPSVAAALAATGIGFGLALLPELPFLAATVRRGRIRRRHVRAWLAFAAPLLPAYAFGVALMHGDRLLGGLLLAPADVGLYGAAWTMADRPLAIIAAMLSLVGFPLAVRTLEREGEDACRRVLRANADLFVAVMFAAAAGLVLCAPALMRILVDEAHAPAAAALAPWITLAAVAARCSTDLFDHAFYLRKRTGRIALTTGVGLAVLGAAGWSLMPAFGAFGAAWAAWLGYAATAAVSAALGSRLLRTWPGPGAVLRAAAATAFMAAAVRAAGPGDDALGLLVTVALGGTAWLAAALAVDLCGARALLAARCRLSAPRGA